MGKMERIHKKTILIIIGILLLLGISCVNSCSKEKQQNAKTGVYPAEGTDAILQGMEAENSVSSGNAPEQKAPVVYTGEETIRVLIQNSDYQGIFHKEVKLSSDTEWELHYGLDGELTEKHAGGEELLLDENSAWFTECARIVLSPAEDGGKISLLSVNRSHGTPAYRGSMEIRKTGQGFVVINELPVEEYLYGVVPSEMPVSYPMEALKAQAICARTYVYAHLESPGYEEYGAHVDDSTGYQVYNNTAEKEEAIQAVQETKGEVVRLNGELVDTYYYSTSCGFGADERVWNPGEEKKVSYLTAVSISETAMQQDQNSAEIPGTEYFTAQDMCRGDYFHEFLHNPPETDFERQEPWYRWSITVESLDTESLRKVLKERQEAEPDRILVEKNGDKTEPVGSNAENTDSNAGNAGGNVGNVGSNAGNTDSNAETAGEWEDIGRITDIRIGKRGDGGIAESLVIKGEKKTVTVLSQYNIRAVLCAGGVTAVRQDGSKVELKMLLPSAFFEIESVKEGENMIGYKLYGGGYGHGAGMSQNAARHMAEKGYTTADILLFFYRDCKIENVRTET
ncbi:MAG: SpoIID/LytB domain-containing protein [Lachnospiraceae bacterium]|nr:SpoIID/LytB domain-containing protein [Lachnospiraceae bacterium]